MNGNTEKAPLLNVFPVKGNALALYSARIPVTQGLGFRIRFSGLGLGSPSRIRA
jgi:hypothetical protein